MIEKLTTFAKDQDSKFIYLALMLAFLPSFEAPKNLFAIMFVISWFLISKREGDWGWQMAINRYYLFVLDSC